MTILIASPFPAAFAFLLAVWGAWEENVTEKPESYGQVATASGRDLARAVGGY